MQTHEKTVNLLFKELIKSLGVKKGDIIRRDQFVSWFDEHHPEIKKDTISTYLLKLSTNLPDRLKYNIHPDGKDDLLYQIDDQSFCLYDSKVNPKPIHNGSAVKVDELAFRKEIENFYEEEDSVLELGMKLFR